MALSPIKMFQSDQSSLAQILQGGNQTITSIMDKAIQIGRDMSNKQLSQERDLLAMRQQETNLMQRRAENTQQDIEDSRRFARGVFESNRNYGLNERQENRASAQQLFSQGIAERGAAVSEGGLRLREQELNMRGQEAEQRQAEARASATARSSEISNLLAPPPTMSPEQAAGRASTIGSVLASDKDLPLNTREALATEQARVAGLFPTPPTPRLIDPVLAEGRKLDVEKKTLDLFKTKAKTMLTGSPDAFVPTGSWMAQTYGTEAAVGGGQQIKRKTASQAGASPEEIRRAEAYQEDPVAAEMAFAETYATADEYADALENATPKARQARINFWNEYMKTKTGTTSTPAAPGAAPSDVDTYLDKKL